MLFRAFCTGLDYGSGKGIKKWDVGVAWQDGRMFHGENCIRLNLALPLSRIKEAFKRMDQYVFHGK